MQTLFSSCLEQTPSSQQSQLDIVNQLPLKIKIANSLGLTSFIVKYFAQPKKKEKYTFPRTFLRFIFNQNCHIPLVYFPVACPSISQILVYCHGSGSNLNNVYQFAYQIASCFGIAVLTYDYTGDGESQKSFSSYEQDLRLVLSWVIRQGYSLARTIICGFSMGSYSALAIEGQMPRILISPVCGILSFLNGQAKRFEDQRYDTVQKALKLQTNCLIFHCSQQMVHISHSKLLVQALQRNNQENQVIFHEITHTAYEHRTAPSYLFSKQGSRLFQDFIQSNARKSKNIYLDQVTLRLQRQLFEIVFFQTESATLVKLDSLTTI